MEEIAPMSPGNLRLLRPGISTTPWNFRAWPDGIRPSMIGRLLWLDPQGCFGIELDDRIVATTTLLCYGDQLAWIGMVLTDYRRRGFAQRLMQTALARAASLGTKSIALDATPEGQHSMKSWALRPSKS
jgi:GNAT superfamily N-acetyltransferase